LQNAGVQNVNGYNQAAPDAAIADRTGKDSRIKPRKIVAFFVSLLI
jgi:hypothetical protein